MYVTVRLVKNGKKFLILEFFLTSFIIPQSILAYILYNKRKWCDGAVVDVEDELSLKLNHDEKLQGSLMFDDN